MRGGEARCLERILGTHAEFHKVQDDLKGGLILLVAACYRDCHYGIIVMEKERGAQRDPRPFARLI